MFIFLRRRYYTRYTSFFLHARLLLFIFDDFFFSVVFFFFSVLFLLLNLTIQTNKQTHIQKKDNKLFDQLNTFFQYLSFNCFLKIYSLFNRFSILAFWLLLLQNIIIDFKNIFKLLTAFIRL